MSSPPFVRPKSYTKVWVVIECRQGGRSIVEFGLNVLQVGVQPQEDVGPSMVPSVVAAVVVDAVVVDRVVADDGCQLSDNPKSDEHDCSYRNCSRHASLDCSFQRYGPEYNQLDSIYGEQDHTGKGFWMGH